jgi:aspartate racemase
MLNRIIGILGGMGPEATLDFYREIIALTPASKDQDHIPVLIYSNPEIPDRTEAISGDGDDPLPLLIETARVLEKGGAGIIAMPCNSAHHYLADLQASVGIPILNMIEETCRTVRASLPSIKSVGLLATVGAIHSGIFDRVFNEAGLKVLIPAENDQKKLQTEISRIKAGEYPKSMQKVFESMGAHLIKAGAGAIILGCTEIPLVFNPVKVDYLCFNPGKILAQASVDWALGKRN